MFNRTKSRKPLSELEHLVMDLVWSRQTATAEQVREALLARRPMKESTVRTVLRRLEEKGYVRHRVEGRTYIYTGNEAPQSVAARSVRAIRTSSHRSSDPARPRRTATATVLCSRTGSPECTRGRQR